jgi:hypothetical protein
MKFFPVFLVFIILALPVFSFRIVNTGIAADDFSAYGTFIAYEFDGSIFVYDIKSKDNFFIAYGESPSVYGFIVAFHSSEKVLNRDVNLDGDFDDYVIRFYDVRKGNLVDTDFIGKNPSVYGNTIFFEVFEGDVGLDLNGDGDIDDHVIHSYNLETGVVKNLGFVGKNVFAGLNVIAFETDEKELGYDLNLDSELNDVIIRLFFLDDSTPLNTGIIGKSPFLFKDKFLVFTSNEAFYKKDINNNGELNDDFPVVVSLPDLDFFDLRLTGSFPSVYESVVLFSEDNKLRSYSIIHDSWVGLDIYASKSVLLGDYAVILTHEKLVGDLNNDGNTDDAVLRIVYFEDLDNDGFLDLIDNCPDVPNDLSDWNYNGVGDACDPEEPPVVSEEKLVDDFFDVADDIVFKEEEGVVLSLSSEEKDSSFFSFFFFLLVLLFLIILFFKFFPKYIEKKRKGFGF